MYSYGSSHLAEQTQDHQLEHIYLSYVRIRDVVLKTCQRRWMIGKRGERGSGISVLATCHDDDDDDMCPWCNGYIHWKWKRQHQLKSWTRLITVHIALIPFGNVWIQLFSLQPRLYTGWNDKNVVLKKTTLQLYFKTFIEKINSGNLIM